MSVIIKLIDDKENDEYSCVMYLNFMLRFINLAFNPKVHAVSPESFTKAVKRLDKDLIVIKIGAIA